MRSVSSPIAVSMTIGTSALGAQPAREVEPALAGQHQVEHHQLVVAGGARPAAPRAPSRAAVTRKPWRSRKRASRSRISRSSSTTRMCGGNSMRRTIGRGAARRERCCIPLQCRKALGWRAGAAAVGWSVPFPLPASAAQEPPHARPPHPRLPRRPDRDRHLQPARAPQRLRPVDVARPARHHGRAVGRR